MSRMHEEPAGAFRREPTVTPESFVGKAFEAPVSLTICAITQPANAIIRISENSFNEKLGGSGRGLKTADLG